MTKIDYKKEYKDLYMPKKKPSIIDVPEMVFIMVDGRGNPNTAESYKNALEILYGLSFTIKMSKMSGTQPEGYFDYVVPPLEGLWWLEDKNFDGKNEMDKDKFCWTSMIRQPEFVTEEVFEWAKESLQKKKPGIDFSATGWRHLKRDYVVRRCMSGLMMRSRRRYQNRKIYRRKRLCSGY